MILTLDIGNTTIGVCGVERTGQGDYQVRFSRKLPTLGDEADYGPLLAGLLDLEGCPEIEGSVMSSVVPRLDGPVSQAAEGLLGRAPVKIQPGRGLPFAIPHPELLGLDRIADAVWAAKRYPLPVVTVDLGTATTFNVLNGEGVFLGGLIVSGLETGVKALTDRTARLPSVTLSRPEHLIGRDTEECMRSGAVTGTAALIDGITARIEAELGPVTLVLTGGWADLVSPLCLHPHDSDPYLLPKGLALLYDRMGNEESGAR